MSNRKTVCHGIAFLLIITVCLTADGMDIGQWVRYSVISMTAAAVLVHIGNKEKALPNCNRQGTHEKLYNPIIGEKARFVK